MGQTTKRIFIWIFIGIVIYTCYAIFQLGKQEGPCNGGIAIIVLMPFLILCIILLKKTFPFFSIGNVKNLNRPIVFAIISLGVWSYWFYTFSEEGFTKTMGYLGLFEGANLFILFVLLRQRIISKQATS